MPYKTQYGSHYHMTEGCHGADIPCDAAGLAPCSDCCASLPDGTADGKPCGSGGSPSAGFPTGPEGTGNVVNIGHDESCDRSSADEITYETQQEPVRSSDELVSKGTEGLSVGLDVPEADIDAEGICRSDDGIRQQFGYRSELLFGEGYTEAAPVMAHETFVLGNTDILLHLADGVLDGTEVADTMRHVASVMDGEEADSEVSAFLDRCYDDQDECAEGTRFFEEVVLPAIKEKTGHDIRHVLWLCDCPEDVIGAYGSIEDITEDDIDEHEVGVMTMSDIGEDGKLWGYEHEIERPDSDMWW